MKTLFFVSALLVFTFSSLQAQDAMVALDADKIESALLTEKAPLEDALPAFDFEGQSINEYIADHLVYPERAKEYGVEGTVVVQFTVTTSGEIINPKVVKKVGLGCDKAALDVIKNMPGWKAGIVEGQYADTTLSINFNFRLQ
jgi:TonB family protein